MTLSLIERLRESPSGSAGMRPVKSPLTAREWEVIDLLKASKTTDEIADELVLSTETVRSHVKNILRKLDVRSRDDAVAVADRMRSAPPPNGVLTARLGGGQDEVEALPSARGSTPIVPPRRSISRLQIARPRPEPGTRRSPGTRRHGSKIARGLLLGQRRAAADRRRSARRRRRAWRSASMRSAALARAVLDRVG